MHTIQRMARWLLLGALLAAGWGRQLPAQAAATADPAGPSTSATPPAHCGAAPHTYTGPTPEAITDLHTITSTIHVSGLPPHIWDTQVRTAISHTFPSDLEIYLIQPDSFGDKIALSTRNGGLADNIFANTLWSDQASFGVTEIFTFTNNVNLPYLIPEGALGATHTKTPNGDWKLVIKDTAAGDTGSLNSWSLIITTLDLDPGGQVAIPTYATPKNIPDGGTVTSTVHVGGLDPLTENVSVHTFIRHARPGDLRLTLTSPTGLTTTLTYGQGISNTDLFNGTTWLDDAFMPVTDSTNGNFNGANLDQAQPEGAMGHFTGSNPNGTWTLAAQDVVVNGKTGTLDQWQLVVNGVHCNALFLPAVRR